MILTNFIVISKALGLFFMNLKDDRKKIDQKESDFADKMNLLRKFTKDFTNELEKNSDSDVNPSYRPNDSHKKRIFFR